MIRTEEEVLENYKRIFYDKDDEPIVRKWLVKKGVAKKDLDEFCSDMTKRFLELDSKYVHTKIQYEKYIWTGLKFQFINSKKRMEKKGDYTNLVFVDFSKVKANFIDPTPVCVDDMTFDVICLCEMLSEPACWVLCKMFFDGLVVREIVKFGLYDRKEVKKAMLELKKVFKKYLLCEI